MGGGGLKSPSSRGPPMEPDRACLRLKADGSTQLPFKTGSTQ